MTLPYSFAGTVENVDEAPLEGSRRTDAFDYKLLRILCGLFCVLRERFSQAVSGSL